MAIATMTTKGQITIPKEIRDAMNLQPGDLVDFYLRENHVVEMRARNRSVLDLIGIVKYDGPPVTIEQMRWLGRARIHGKPRRKRP